jgi:hypothetical protein
MTETEEKKPFSRYILKDNGYGEYFVTAYSPHTDNYTPLRWFTGRNAKITAEFYLKFLEEKELASPQNTNSENTNSGRSKAYDSAYDWNRLDYMVDRSTWK